MMRKSGFPWLFFASVFLYVALSGPITGASPLSDAESWQVMITVEERSGSEVRDRIVRRGVPLAPGVLRSTGNLQLRDEAGRTIPIQTEVLKRHAGDDIAWLSVAFRPDLDPGARKVFTLEIDSEGADTAAAEHRVRITNDSEVRRMENEKLRVEFGPEGLAQIVFDEVPLLEANGAALVVSTAEGSYHSWRATGFEIAEEGPVFATVRMSGPFEDIAAEAVWEVTLVAGSARIEQAFRLTSKDDLELTAAGMVANLRPEFAAIDPDLLSGTIRSRAVLDFHASELGRRIRFDAPDIDRFRGAVERADDPEAPANGFLVEHDTDDVRVLFAPIQYRASWMWLDGVSRTTRLDMVFGENGPMESGAPPAAFVAPEQFVKAGVLPSRERPPSAQRAVDWTMGALNERDGHFEAGAIPQSIIFNDDGSVWVGGSASRPGETVYNLWYVQMQDGCPDLFRMLAEDTESWADVVVYRGSNEFFNGADRYGTLGQYGTFRSLTSHPYYGDASGLYLSYLMTGERYFRDTFELMTRYAVRTSNEYPTYGDYRVPRRFTWDGEFEPRPFIESRNMMQARGLAYAERMFGDEAFGEIAGQLAHWARHVQHEKGFWYQAYFDHGGPLTQRALDLPSAKNYIMLYGVRALVSFRDHLEKKRETLDGGELGEVDRESLDATETALIRFADYLLEEQQAHGWLWDPISDGGDFAAKTNEDMRRGQMPRQEIMAIEVLEGVYRMTGEERYLSSMLEMLRYYLAIQQEQGGWSSRNQHREHEDGTVQGPFLGNNTAQFLRIVPRLQVLIESEREAVNALGFRDVAAVLSADARDIRSEIDHGFDSREVGFNAFATPEGRVIYLANYSGWMSGDWVKTVDLRVAGEPVLFEGTDNRITANGVWLSDELEQFKRLYARELPVTLRPENGPVEARVLECRTNLLVVDLRGEGSLDVTIGDGPFAIEDGKVYGVLYAGQAIGSLRPDEGKISFRLSLPSETRLERLTVRPLAPPSGPL